MRSTFSQKSAKFCVFFDGTRHATVSSFSVDRSRRPLYNARTVPSQRSSSFPKASLNAHALSRRGRRQVGGGKVGGVHRDVDDLSHMRAHLTRRKIRKLETKRRSSKRFLIRTVLVLLKFDPTQKTRSSFLVGTRVVGDVSPRALSSLSLLKVPKGVVVGRLRAVETSTRRCKNDEFSMTMSAPNKKKKRIQKRSPFFCLFFCVFVTLNRKRCGVSFASPSSLSKSRFPKKGRKLSLSSKRQKEKTKDVLCRV